MITSTIGRIFLDAYNKKNGKHYDAKTFFVEVYYPLFFDSNKYMLWIPNSPFVQMKKEQKVDSLTPEERKEKLSDFLTKVEGTKTPDASIAPGYPASEEKEYATTSGQVSNIELPINQDDIYLAWLGSSLGVGLQGSLSILFSTPDILLDIFDGWNLYRTVLSEVQQLKGNQVNTWNGQWLAHRYDRSFHKEQPMADFNPFETTDDGMSVATQTWTMVLIGVSKQYTYPKMMGYVYNFGKTNTTLGFIPFNLEHIRRPLELYKKLFGINEGEKAEKLWGTEIGFRTCCQRGAIGIEAMQPKGLSQYMTADKDKNVKLPKYKEDDAEQTLSFHTYQIWLLAMLNNQELWEKSFEFAKALNAYAGSGKNIKTTNSRQIDAVTSATNKRTFMEALSAIAPDIQEIAVIQEIAMIVNSMSTDNVTYFLTLVRFHTESLKNSNVKQ